MSHDTMKFLIAITPNGLISFMSDLWCGCATDKHLVQAFGLLMNLEHNDHMMADTGVFLSKKSY